ncbi:DUF4102 domain-containing protein [Cupriavidus basilensis]|uniref:DUF4102 domain-containing protein n=1 Tax=Cupriavidus basilensis TaxID=68895 RepID=A0A643FNF3_9BURK|nr:DUF4102 domain-containing protein [Cupriavidus basilensis]
MPHYPVPRKNAKARRTAVCYEAPQCEAEREALQAGWGGGLFLEVTPDGRKLWRFRYFRPSGNENRLGFGVYPEVPLAQARAQRDAARAVLATRPGSRRREGRAAPRGRDRRGQFLRGGGPRLVCHPEEQLGRVLRRQGDRLPRKRRVPGHRRHANC